MKEKYFTKIRCIYLLLGLCLFLFTSCEVLDEDPFTEVSTENFYQNKTDALAALTGAYARLKSGNGYYRQTFLSGLHASSDQGLSSYLWNDFKTGTITSTNQNLFPMWRDIYFGIRDANNVIAYVPPIVMDEELKARIIGEARFLRALHYFNLVRCFGEVPLRTTPIQAGEDEGLPLSSIKDIYDVIIGDLQYATENCWGRNEARNSELNDLGRVTKAAAHAMLAKVYSRIASCKRTAETGVEGNNKYLDFLESTGNYYQLAKEQCDLVLNESGFQLAASVDDYNTIFDPNNGNNLEMIFEVQGSSIVGQGTAVSNLFSPQNSGLSGTGFGGSNKLKPLFVNNRLNKDDSRFQNTIIKEYENTSWSFSINDGSTGYNATSLDPDNTNTFILYQTWTSKYIDTEATTEYTSRQNWHIIRLADVYLMRAEAMVEISQDPSLANSDFNMLRNRVEISDFNGGGMSMENFRIALLQERAVELYMEGHRFFDLTRMGVLDEYCRFLHGDTDGARQAEDYFWPIPIEEVTANGNI